MHYRPTILDDILELQRVTIRYAILTCARKPTSDYLDNLKKDVQPTANELVARERQVGPTERPSIVVGKIGWLIEVQFNSALI